MLLFSDIPGAQQRIVPAAGHLAPMEKPEKFNALALEFLAQRSPK